MKERIVVFFLCALGTFKVYENLSGDDELDDDIKTLIKPRIIFKRSLNNMLEEWSNEQIIDEELLEAVNAKLSERLKSSCQKVVENECSCRQLLCFDESNCKKSIETPVRNPKILSNQPKSQDKSFQEIRCRQTIIYDQRLCECKKYTIETVKSNPKQPLKEINPVDPNPAGLLGERLKLSHP